MVCSARLTAGGGSAVTVAVITTAAAGPTSAFVYDSYGADTRRTAEEETRAQQD